MDEGEVRKVRNLRSGATPLRVAQSKKPQVRAVLSLHAMLLAFAAIEFFGEPQRCDS